MDANEQVDGIPDQTLMSRRFRGFLPVVVDVETGGFDDKNDALLEVCALTLNINETGVLSIKDKFSCHVEPFPGSNLNPKSLEVNGIDPFHPFRLAKPEKNAITEMFKFINTEMKNCKCTRAIMIGHNTTLDLNFIYAAANRCKVKHNPFHPFSTFDTVSISGMAFGQTVLSRAVIAAGIKWNDEDAHSAVYDATRTAELFCTILNTWNESNGPVWV